MSVEQQLAAALARIKALEAQKHIKAKIKLSDGGYIEVHGIPSKGWRSMSATAAGWKVLLDMSGEITQFIEQNKASIAAADAAYQAKRAVG